MTTYQHFEPKAVSPAKLAERWDCSERHIRNMIERGEIPSFRLGGKLLRVKMEDVERFECQTNQPGESPDSTENAASPGKNQTEDADVIDLEQRTKQRRPALPRLDLRNTRGHKAQR